jgi:hypothetical protein
MEVDIGFTTTLPSLLGALGQYEGQVLALTGVNTNFYPRLFLNFHSASPSVLTDFVLSNGETLSVKVENTTGLNKASPHSYRHLNINEVRQRLDDSGFRLVGIDHLGFNLPWFEPGLHPEILRLRKELSTRCLYHRFPTGEPWDFILPGDIDEIERRKTVDYTLVRRPKFELVSFDKASTPLVQLDVGVNASYESFSALFPEALNDPGLRNIWVYLENPTAIDLCLVLNEAVQGDWGDFFAGSRL